MKFTLYEDDNNNYLNETVFIENNKNIFEEKEDILNKDELLNQTLNIIYDNYISKYSSLKSYISILYNSIIYMKYYKEANDGFFDISNLSIFVSFFIKLKESYKEYEYKDKINEICIECYNNKRNSYERLHNLMSEEIEEEFKPEHLLDLEYHLNNFEIWAKDFEDVKNRIKTYKELIYLI